MKTIFTTLGILLLATVGYAQPRPGAFTTLTATTLTTTGSITDGGALTVGSTLGVSGASTLTGAVTLTGGVSGNLTASGLLTVNGFGTSTFSAAGTGQNVLAVRNTSAGTTNAGAFVVGNDSDALLTGIQSFSSTFTPGLYAVANGSVLFGEGAGGLSIATNNAVGIIRFYSGSAIERGRILAAGGFSWGNTIDPGSGGIIANSQIYVGTNTAGVNRAFINGTAIQLLDTSDISQLSITKTNVSVSNGLTQMDGSAGFVMGTWPTTGSAANANVVNGAAVKLSTSIRASKHDIEPIALIEARRTVMGLQAILYQSRVDVDQRQWAGFIAEDIEKVNPILAVYRPDGPLLSVTYDRVPVYLVPVVQDHEARLAALEKLLQEKR